MIQDAKFTRSGNAQECRERGAEPEGFKWEANGIGSIVVTPHVTVFDFTVEGYNFKAHLTKEVSLFHPTEDKSGIFAFPLRRETLSVWIFLYLCYDLL